MNHRNLDALADRFSAMLVAWRLQSTDGPEPDPSFAAEFLASHGTLVPSALTDDEAVKIGADVAGVVPSDRSEIALCVRQGLERIAKGELQ